MTTLKTRLLNKYGTSPRKRWIIEILPFNLFVWLIALLYILPVLYMVVAAMMPTEQLGDREAPLYPAVVKTFKYNGIDYKIYHVPTADGLKEWALIDRGLEKSNFIDPQNPEAGLIEWQGHWTELTWVYQLSPTWDNFKILFSSLPFPSMILNTLMIVFIGEIGVLISSVLVAYGFARFSLPGGNLLFYILIATILIPEKITFIPSYYFFIRVLQWRDTLYPILLPLYFGNAVYIFLLRQNFKSISIELEEAAMLDGAGPLHRLFSVILPQSWPVITTVALLHFFYTWNESRQA
ncbi:MAG TPA: carbohydrate ABC transporter permease, partial [Chloroflexi bacterium]|nr:carbohydrate ABC transporter permease [Chloroflexota bacterium]